MEVIIKGHKYKMSEKGSSEHQLIQFYQDGKINNTSTITGVTNQEVLRVLIDRVQFLDKQLPSKYNDEILLYLRKALVLHECRALERKVEKGLIYPEKIEIATDAHFSLTKKI